MTRRRHFVPRSCFPPLLAPALSPLSLFHSRSTAAKTRRNRGMLSTRTAPPPPPLLYLLRLPSYYLADYYVFLSFIHSRFFPSLFPCKIPPSFGRNIEEEKKAPTTVLSSVEKRLRSKDSLDRSIDEDLCLCSVERGGERTRDLR